MGTGRHVSHSPGRQTPRRGLLIVAAVVVAALLVSVLSWVRSGGEAQACEREQTVDVDVAPELSPIARAALTTPIPIGGRACAVARVTPANPLQTVGDLLALPPDKLPDVWIPDSSLWRERADRGPRLESVTSLASTPLVIAISQSAADRFGWTGTAPTWADALVTALGAGQGLAAPEPQTAIDMVATTVTFRSLGGVDKAQVPILRAALASARDAWTPASGLAAGRAGRPDAPLVPAREQDVLAGNLATPGSKLVAIYPSDGTPTLDYPITRVGDPDPAERRAVDAVITALTSPATRSAVLAAGFRDAAGQPPRDAGPRTGTSPAVPHLLAMDPAEVRQFQAMADNLLQPARILAVLDVSTSMRAAAGDADRITLARDTMKSALALLPDSFAVGLWAFAADLDGRQDWAALAPPAVLGRAGVGGSQRDRLSTLLDTLPSRLTGGGTALYDTTLAAVRHARASFDPAAVNTVLVLTDGKNEDSAGITLDQLLQALHAEGDPDRPIQVLAIALGPDADKAALDRIAAATNGQAFAAGSSADLQQVLFDALRHRGS
ncbi:MAG: uncharacterized protein JWL64_32 [Frankiales bacterium]|nr:uncharacterized protein [Frankiales bacterium]